MNYQNHSSAIGGTKAPLLKPSGSKGPATTRGWPRIAAAAAAVAASALIACVLLLSPLTAMAAGNADPVRVAVFDFELIDTSLEGELTGPKEAEAARLTMITDQLRQFFAAAPGISLVDIEDIRGSAADRKLHGCNGCVTRLASELDADLAVTGTVQKVSNLILNINIHVRDVATGEMIYGASADIRGNTDETWRRGMKWLIENRLADLPLEASAAGQ